MKNKQLMRRLIPMAVFLIGVLSIIAMVATFVIAGRGDTAAYKKVFLRIAGVLFLLLSGLSFYYLYISRDTDPNFFLYDQKQKRNLPSDALTFRLVNERMDFYLSLISSSEKELWCGDVLAQDETVFGAGAVYRPLVAYKMLYDLTVENTEESWDYLEHAEVTTIRMLTRALRQAKDEELARAIVELYKGENVPEGENLRDFLCENQKYMRGCMLRYVKQHLDSFC